MPYPNKLKKLAQARRITEEELLRGLMNQYRTPLKAAMSVDMYPNAILAQLKKRGWQFIDGQWVEPTKESA